MLKQVGKHLWRELIIHLRRCRLTCWVFLALLLKCDCIVFSSSPSSPSHWGSKKTCFHSSSVEALLQMGQELAEVVRGACHLQWLPCACDKLVPSVVLGTHPPFWARLRRGFPAVDGDVTLLQRFCKKIHAWFALSTIICPPIIERLEQNRWPTM